MKQEKDKQTIAAILAFVPITGALGVHDFLLKKYGKGFAHIVIASIYFVPDIFNLICDATSCSSKYALLSLLLYYVRYLSAISAIWAVVEGVKLLQKKDDAEIANQNLSQNAVPHDSIPSGNVQAPPNITELSESIYPKAQNPYSVPLEQSQTAPQVSQASHKSDDNQYSRYLIAGMIGIFTGLGAFGVHDFIVGRKKQGIIHVVMGSTVIFTPFVMAPMMCDYGCDVDTGRRFLAQFLFGLSILAIISLVTSNVWAFVESAKILSRAKYLPR